MELFLGDLRETYGSVEAYAESVGVDHQTIGRMQDDLLELGS